MGILRVNRTIPDYCAHNGASELADRVCAFWRKLGYEKIEVRIAKVDDAEKQSPSHPEHGEIFRLISNIGPTGFPPV